MKRILYIDTYSEFGHNALNQVIISKFLSLGLALDIIMKAGYTEQLGISGDFRNIPIPLRFYSKRRGRFSDRYYHTLLLLYLKKTIQFSDYEHVFMSSFDEIPLYLARLPIKPFLVVHANVSALDNPIKGFFMRSIARHSTLVVFHEFIKQRCLKFGLSRVIVEPQGLSAPYALDQATKRRALYSIDPRLTESTTRHIAFAPSGAKYHDEFIKEVIQSSEFCQMLAETNTMFVVKGVSMSVHNANIVTLAQHLNSEQYQSLFMASECIALSYPATFNFRISAILLECFSNNVPCLLSDIEGFRVFAPHFRYCPYFANFQEFREGLRSILTMGTALKRGPYMNTNALNPGFSAFSGGTL